jgi:osmoprotectant transport system permease protein
VEPSRSPSNPWFSWDYVVNAHDVLLRALLEHIFITVIVVLIASAIAIPLGLMAVRWRVLATPMLITAGMLYTIPSLALIVGLWPVFGLSVTTVIVALTLYSLLVILRNTIVGLQGVPPDVLLAARAMGYQSWGSLTRVALPIATPAVMAGVKLATVSTVGLVMVGALVGHGGLGSVVLNGFTNNFYRAPILLGTFLTVLLALGLEFALTRAQRQLTPWVGT